MILGDVASAYDNADNTTSSVVTAACLASGWLPLPHFGDWTQEGQPASHRHSAMISRVADSHSRAAAYARSAKPAPPGWPS